MIKALPSSFMVPSWFTLLGFLSQIWSSPCGLRVKSTMIVFSKYSPSSFVCPSTSTLPVSACVNQLSNSLLFLSTFSMLVTNEEAKSSSSSLLLKACFSMAAMPEYAVLLGDKKASSTPKTVLNESRVARWLSALYRRDTMSMFCLKYNGFIFS